MRASRVRFRSHAVLSLCLTAAALEACASLGSNDSGLGSGPTIADSGSFIGVSGDGSANDGATQPDGSRPVNPLCGKVGYCGVDNVPDDPTACPDVPTEAGPRGSPDGGVSRDAGRDGSLVQDAGVDAGSLADGGALRADASSDAAPSDGGPPRSPDAGPPADGGARGRPGFLDAKAPYAPSPSVDAGPRSSCQVRSSDNGQPVHACAAAGPGGVGDPCSAGWDCRAGLACVAAESSPGATTGQCQPYCCASACRPEARPDGGPEPTFCTPRPLLEGRGVSRLAVPVCVPADHCSLDEPYPCPPGQACKCTGDTACAVVKGATACVQPGKSRLGEPCDPGGAGASGCAWGYFCSAAGTCLKQCRTTATEDVCVPGKCQAAAGLPAGWGLCEGAPPLAR